ncbi:MAG: serine/threonine-protein phosphatase, partial [bacterium]|nr:serine/threonine-protein phosphatase [bacterium]
GIAACTEPARVVGGDYFEFFSYDSGAQGFVIADVMGKGLQASMLMSNIQASLRILGPEYTCMHSLTARLNELFRSNLKLVSFITMFLARLDAGSGVLQYCNAGHNPPLLWEAASGSFQWLKPTGPAIGLTKSACFKSGEVKMSKGDLLFMYTDGLVEAQNSRGVDFGTERVAAFIKENSQSPVNVLINGLRESAKSFAGNFDDDVPVMAGRLER